MKLRCALLSLCLLLPARAGTAADTPVTERFAALFVGTFSSAQQALADKNYRNVTVHSIRIWPERTDGLWFYVEHALAEGLDQPYRQRVHQAVAGGDGTLELRSYTLDDPLKATGAWRRAAPLADFSRNDLTYHEGCTVFLRAMPDGAFAGATRGDGCANDLRGASHSTAELTLTVDRFTFWERGYNAAGRQVWGTADGGYVFQRLVAP